LLSRLQQERKAKQQQQQQQQEQQQLQQQHMAKEAAPKAPGLHQAHAASPPVSKQAPPAQQEHTDGLLVTQQATAEPSSCGQAATAEVEGSRSPSWLYELD
jgi:hypothetical protein